MYENDADTITNCTNCGKGEENSGDLKSCAACMLVKYCGRDCQIAHRPLHKKACKKRAAELHDEALFKEHPPPEDCPICLVPLPLDAEQTAFQSCCGKIICAGCTYAMARSTRGRGKIDLCAFCREPNPTSAEETVKQIQKLIAADNAYGYQELAGCYTDGVKGMPQDFAKANELWLKAGELGCAEGYYSLGYSYSNGKGVEVDNRKARHYYELAAMNGIVYARHNLGCEEIDAGNHNRAKKHFILAARAGHKDSLEMVKRGFRMGIITKDEYADTLRAYQKIHDEMKSDTRDKAAALYRRAAAVRR